MISKKQTGMILAVMVGALFSTMTFASDISYEVTGKQFLAGNDCGGNNCSSSSSDNKDDKH